ncbi:hypothetical protein JOC95_001539 [Bacillus tianshenii]|uniref:Lipoprotein n=1 Tax=Sutcliffiella tianshenii TaxID=1463404 RepID=A0ABS2NYH5_9BACI|nr:hypothetical protein [Bacillus tianshenii]MBM7619687.1 hypothetical protein [Bacillus tianshenii]
MLRKSRMVFLLLILLLVACSKQLESGELVHEEQTGPFSQSVGDKLVEIIFNLDDFEVMWNAFNFEAKPLDVDFEEFAIIFAHTSESSTCPVEVDKMVLVDTGSELTIDTVQKGSNCTSDAVLKTFVFKIEKDKLEKVEIIFF